MAGREVALFNLIYISHYLRWSSLYSSKRFIRASDPSRGCIEADLKWEYKNLQAERLLCSLYYSLSELPGNTNHDNAPLQSLNLLEQPNSHDHVPKIFMDYMFVNFGAWWSNHVQYRGAR